MKTSEFHELLARNPDAELAFVLPDGGRIAAHAHITEVGRVDKTFFDCGGTLRRTSACTLQAWEAHDVDHRFPAGKLAAVLEKATEVIGPDNPPVEIEYKDGLISQFPVTSGEFVDGLLVFQLEIKHTACLAPEICLPEERGSECHAGSGCC